MVTPTPHPAPGPTVKRVVKNLRVGIAFSFRKILRSRFLFVSVILRQREKRTYEFRDFSNY